MEYDTDSKLMWLEVMRLASAQCEGYEYCCLGSKLWHMKEVAGELWLMLESGPPDGLVDLPYMTHSEPCTYVTEREKEMEKVDGRGWVD